MGRRRIRTWVFTAVAVVAAAVGGWMLRGAKIGDIDPFSAMIGFPSLLTGVVAAVLAVRAWQWQETNVNDLADRLARTVTYSEQRARSQLLGGHDKPIDVEFTFRPAPAHNAAAADPAGQLAKVADYYQQLRPRRMVITGVAGAGKTVLAVELILALLDPGTRRPSDPVPVRVSAASWNLPADPHATPGQTAERVQQWLASQLINTYSLSEHAAKTLVEAGQVLLVLDGLDEMDARDAPGYASRAGQALRALNAWQQHRAKTDLVVTCRTGQYEALTADNIWIEDSAHIDIQPVTTDKACPFITDRAVNPDRWKPVLDAITATPGGALAAGLSTPWRLTLAVIVYEQRDPTTGAFSRDPAQLTALALSLNPPTISAQSGV